MIHFVGAGCGAPDLITVRGQRLLREADVVIYAGSLVNPALLEETKSDCEVYNSASMTLARVIETMCAAENAGKSTVRLHTGDPSIYGAIREQIDQLDERGIDYDVTPGVSSFCGAAAALAHLQGAELTLPDVSQTVILTRMAGRTQVPEREEIASLAAHRATMVIFLSAGMIPQMVNQLIAGGYPSDTPAAIVYKASWPDEKTLLSPLETLASVAQEHGIEKTALVMVGDFLGDRYKVSRLYDPSFGHGCREAER